MRRLAAGGQVQVNGTDEKLHVAPLGERAVGRANEVGRARRAEEARVMREEVFQVGAGELFLAGRAKRVAPRVIAALALGGGEDGSSRGEDEGEDDREASKHNAGRCLGWIAR